MNPLVETTSKYVESLLSAQLPASCLYHNYTHAKRVYKSAKEILEGSSISEEDNLVVLLAALLHDIGHIKTCDGHEEISAQMATEYLVDQNVSQQIIDKVVQCILATKMEIVPVTEIEKIIRDADASHFAKDYFQEASEFLRLEWQLQGRVNYSKRKWLKVDIDMLQNKHQYFTEYAIQHWNPKKEENIKQMMTDKAELEKEKKAKEKKTKEELKAIDPEKAIQSVFRVTLKNHIKLSDIADTKANILLSVNAIILSIALSNLIPKLDNASNTYLIIPTMIFLTFTLISMLLSVMATRPNVTSGKFTKEDVNEKRVNLLFFGNFHKMSLNEFEWAMNEMLADKEYIYSSLTKDLYFLGLVLQRKYKILRLTYTIFMIGILVSVSSFAIAFIISETNFTI